MADKKLEVNVQHIIKDIEAGKFTSFQSILNETGGQHIYEAVNEELRKYLKENNAVMISATQLAHLRETGYKDFESERKALETQLKTATGDLKKQIESKLKDLKKFQYYSERKAPIGDELHKILELSDKGLVDLNDAVKAANQIMQQMQIDPHTSEKLKSLVGRTSTDTMKNFRKAIKNAQDFQKMKISAGMIGGETETARSMAFKKDGKLYVVSGSTDWTKAKEGKIGDYKTTASFSAMHNLIQSVVNATLIRAQEGENLPITSKVAHLPISAGRTKYSNTLPGVYDINVGSYQEGVKLISDLVDVLEGKRDYTSIRIPGSVQGKVEKGQFTYKNEIKEATYYNGKPIGQWIGQTVEEVKGLLDSLAPQQRQQFLGTLFGQTDGKPWYNTENAKMLKEAFRGLYQPIEKQYKTYGGMTLGALSGKFSAGDIGKQDVINAIKEGVQTQIDTEELASRLFYGGEKYYSEAFVKVIQDAIPEISDKMTEIFDRELDKDMPGYLSGLGEGEKLKPSKYEMYQPDVWELEEKRQQAWIESGVERKRLGYTDKPLFDDKGVTTLADRMTRLVDFYQRVNNIFTNIANDINKDLPEGTQAYTGEELARTYLARKSPEVYDRYMRSKGLYEQFTSEAQNLSIEDQVKWVREQLDTFIAEEGNLLNTFDTFNEIADERSKKIFSTEFARKIGYVGKPSDYVAPGTLYGLLTGSTFGVAQEYQLSEFDKQRGLDIYGRTLSPEALDKLEETQVDDDISKIDFYKKRLSEMTEELGMSSEKMKIFTDYLDKVQKVADQAGIELDQVLEGIDEKGFIKKGSLLDKQLSELGEMPVETDLYLPRGKRGLSASERSTLMELLDETGMDNLTTQYEIYLNEQDNKRKEELQKQEEIRVEKEKEFTKLMDSELENRLKFLYAETQKPEYLKRQEAAERGEDLGLTEEMFKNFPEKPQKGLDIGETKPEIVKVAEENVAQTTSVNESNQELAEVIKEEVEAKKQEINSIKSDNKIQDVRKRGKINNEYDNWVVDKIIKNELGEVTDTIYKRGRKSSGTRGPSGISQVVDKVIPAVESIDQNIKEINEKIPSSFKNIDWDSFQNLYNKTGISSDECGAPTGGSGGRGDKKGGETDEKKAEEQQLKENLKTEREYQQYLNQRFSLLSKIESAQAKYNISIGKEKEAAAGVVETGNIELKYLDKKNEALIRSMEENQNERKAQMDYQQELKVATMQQQKLLGTKGAKSLWDVMGNDIQRAAVRITDFGLAAKALNKIPQDIQKIIQYTKELDAAMTNIRIVGGYTEEQAKNLTKKYIELGSTLSVTTTEIAQGMNDWLRQGYEAEDQLEALVTASTKLSKLGMISTTEATTALTSALKAFNLTADDAIKVVDKLTKVDQLAAVSAGGIAESLQKASTSAKLAGMSMDELIGSVSVIGEVTQQSMDTVGNAMKSILARYGNVKASVFTSMGLDDDGETTENINDIEKVLSKLGIRVRSSTTEMRSITDVLDEVNSKWSTFDTVTKNAIATAFGGSRMRENFLVLMENWDRVKELTEESANAAGTADEKYTAYTDSIAASLERLQNAWEKVSQGFEGSWLIKSGLKTLELFVSNLQQITSLLTVAISTRFYDKIFQFGENTIKGMPGAFGKLFGSGSTKQGSITYDENGNMVVSPQETQRDYLLRKGTQQIVDTLDKNGVATNGLLKQIINVLETTSLKGKIQYDQNTGRIISGLSVGNRDVEYKGLDKSGAPIFQYTGGGKVKSKKRIEDLKRQQKLINDYNSQLGVPANPNQMSGYSGLTWWSNKAKNVTIGDKTYALTKVPKEVYGSNYAYIDEYGNDIRDISSDRQKQIDKLNETLREQKQGVRAKMGVTAGISTAISQSAMTKSVGAQSGGFGGWLSKAVLGDKNTQSIKETTEDKVLRVGSASALAAVGGYFLGPIGAMFGNIIGEAGASVVSTIIHQSELEMKQYVTNAKEQLNALNNLDDTLANINLSDKDDTENFAESIKSYFKDNAELTDTFLTSLNKSGLIDDVDTLSDLVKEIKQNSTEDNKKILQALKVETAKQQIEQTYASQKITRKDAEFYIRSLQEIFGIQGDKITTGLVQEIKNTIKENEDTIEQNNFLKVMTNAFNKVIDPYEEANEELLKSVAQYGFVLSNIENLSGYELGNLGIEGAIGLVADELEKQGYIVRTNSKVNADIYDQIYSLIKKSSAYNSLQFGVKTLGELDLGDEKDIKRLEQFARAFGITIEKAKEWKEEFGDLSIQMAYWTPQEVLDYYDSLNSIFEDLAKNAAVSADNIQKILSDSNYSSLIPYLTEGSDSFRKQLYKRLFGDEKDIVYENSLFSSLMTNKDIFQKFSAELGEFLQKEISEAGYTSFQSIISAVQEGNLDENSEIVKKAQEEIESWNVEYERSLEGDELLIKAQTYELEQQINNLTEQKEALSQINDEREKELNLIKARNALENARKEKKRVYRAGVGFVYETDEEALSEAKKELDDLENEKKQEDLQNQIDILQAQKNILDNLPEVIEMEQITSILKEWAGEGDGSFASVTAVTTKLVEKYSDSVRSLDTYKKFIDSLSQDDTNEEDGKGEGRTDVTPQNPSNRVNITGIGRNVFDWGDDDIKIELEGQAFKLHTTDHKDEVGDQEGLDKAYGGAPQKGSFLKTSRGYFVYSGRKWEKIVANKDYAAFDQYYTALENNMNQTQKHANGTLSIYGDERSLLNELGTEAIITPSGTVTALPSKTGIVPADITKNLWSLGEVAPTLVAQLGSLSQKAVSGVAGNTTYEEGQYFDNFTMNVYPASSDDFSKILEQARATVKLTRHNN